MAARKSKEAARYSWTGRRRVLRSEVDPPRAAKSARLFIAVDPFGTLAAASARYMKKRVLAWVKTNVPEKYGWRVIAVSVRPVQKKRAA